MANTRLGTKGTWQLRENHTYAPPGQFNVTAPVMEHHQHP